MPDLSVSPYFDDYDPAKEYTQVLAVAGRSAQARDVTQAQTIIKDLIGRLGSSLYPEGTILGGCSLLISEDKKTVTLSEGRVFLNGLVRNTAPIVLEITGEGTETIGAIVESIIITERDDSSLYDQSEGFVGSGQPGSHRLRESVAFKVNDPTATPLYQLQDGILITSAEQINLDTLSETLARRTYDENGSYKVRGMILRDRKENDADHVYVDISEGKAYIRGYEINKFSSTRVALDKAVDTRRRVNEIHTYSQGSTYRLSYQPVKQLTRVSCLIEYEKEVNRGSENGGSDEIPTDPGIEGSVDSIIEVKAGETVYASGTDYNLVTGNIDWSPDGDEPETGSTYTVKYLFNQKMDLSEFELSDENGVSVVKFNEGSAHPVDRSRIWFDYDYYLCRIDLVTMDSDGELHVYRGNPDSQLDVRSPLNQNDNELVLGTMFLYPNSNEIKVNTFDTIRLSQQNLFNLRRRVDNLEYNVAMSDLDQEAVEGEPATQLRGVFTDGFIGLTKADVTHEDFNCSMDFDNGYLTVPQIESIVGVVPNRADTYSENGGIVSVPYGDEVLINQPNATDGFRVNEYAVFHNMALIELTPYVDNWVDSTKMTVDGGVVNESRSVEVNGGTRTARVTRGGYFKDYTVTEYTTDTKVTTETTTRSQSKILLDEAIYYMRQIPITVHGSNYLLNSDNLECTFNGIHVDLSPIAGTDPGTAPGTVKANAEGEFSAQFTIPEGVPCGSVEVLVTNENNDGGTIFSAQGRKQVIEETVFTVNTTVTTTTKYKTVTTIHDPLAQAFYLNDDAVLTKVGFFFKKKEDGKNLVVQVRNMINGYPGPHLYDQVVVKSDAIEVSEDGSVETAIDFAQPVYLPGGDSYCIAILSDSNKYEMWVAVLGNMLADREELMLSQPYTEGAMFSSSNAVTWTAHQDTDLKFKLYSADYVVDEPVVVEFPEISFGNQTVSGFILTAQTVDYRNSGITWYYRLREESDWIPVQPFIYRPLEELTNRIYVKCELSSDVASVSPFLNKDSVNIIGFKDADSGTYLSRTVTMDQEFNTIKVSFEGYVPESDSYNLYYSTDANNETWTELTDPVETDLGEGWKRYEFTSDSDLNDRICKIKLSMTSGNPLDVPLFRKLITIMKSV